MQAMSNRIIHPFRGLMEPNFSPERCYSDCNLIEPDLENSLRLASKIAHWCPRLDATTRSLGNSHTNPLQTGQSRFRLSFKR